MASYMLIRHKVRDFKTWKVGYDAHRPKRAEAGLTENTCSGVSSLPGSLCREG